MHEIDNSIIIVNWNTQELLEKCLFSIYSKTSEYSFEIIVIDNGSSDDSINMIKTKYPEVILIEADENLGFAKANNRGIKIAIGRYITLLNSDTELVNDAFSKMIQFMDDNTDIGLIGGKLLNQDLTLQGSCREFPTLWRSFLKILFPFCLRKYLVGYGSKGVSHFKYNKIKDVEVLVGALLMVRRDALNIVGGLDESFFFYAEDIDWSRRFWDTGWRVVFFPGSKVIHYGGESSKVAPVKYRVELLKADLVYYSKYSNTIEYWLIYINLILFHIFRIIGYKSLLFLRIKRDDYTIYLLKREIACFRWLIKNRFKKIRKQ